jgi:4-hydroxyacetophenone monooxygenase
MDRTAPVRATIVVAGDGTHGERLGDSPVSAVVDEAFIRRAVELADLSAVRVALFQATGDPELELLGPVAQLSPEDREKLIAKAVDYLRHDVADVTLVQPTEAELRHLMEMATGIPMTDREFLARRDLPAFDEVPWNAEWPGEKPEIPDGFLVAIVGAGFSGLAAGAQFERLGIPYVILERRHEVGGVWSINKYPDARVDTASSTYEYNFEKNYRWTEYFARQSEVRGYLEHVAKKHGMWDHIRFDSDLKEARFDDEQSVWHLKIGKPDGSIVELDANAIVSAVGVFANPRVVKFPGSDQYEGKIVHPTQWSPDYDLEDKSVAVIGNGSTGVQMVAPIAREAKQVYVFQRTAQWISPRPKYGQPVEPEVRWLLDTMPGYWNWSRYMATAALFASHELMVPDPEWQAKGGLVNEKNDNLRVVLTAYIKAQIGDRPDLYEKVAPDYAPMTRRPVVDNGWYAALTRDNVELVTDGIRRFTSSGIETVDGTVRDVDYIITATGFDVIKFLWPAEYIGVDGARLHERWSVDGPRAYLSMMVPEFPNLFMLYGPNSQPVSGGTSLPAWYQIWSRYISRALMRMIEGGYSRVQVSHDAHDRYNEALDAEASGLVLLTDTASVAKNYYINEYGRMQVNAPFESPYFYEMCSAPDWDDLELS